MSSIIEKVSSLSIKKRAVEREKQILSHMVAQRFYFLL